MLDLFEIQIKRFLEFRAVFGVVALDTNSLGFSPADGTGAEFVDMRLARAVAGLALHVHHLGGRGVGFESAGLVHPRDMALDAMRHPMAVLVEKGQKRRGVLRAFPLIELRLMAIRARFRPGISHAFLFLA